jgi:alpha-ketoglutarate-dependent taurine dioxygenase
MPSLAAMKRELPDQGFCLFRASAAEFQSVACELGIPVPARRGGPLQDTLTPRLADEAPPRSLSAMHGLDRFPFHTDAAHHRMPPRYTLLRCSEGASTSVPTLLADFDALGLSAASRCALAREVWLVKGGPRRTFYTSVLTRTTCGPVLRFDLGCMAPAPGTNPAGHRELVSTLETSAPTVVRWEPNLVVAIDNHRILHARPAIQEAEKSRVLERVMIA